MMTGKIMGDLVTKNPCQLIFIGARKFQESACHIDVLPTHREGIGRSLLNKADSEMSPGIMGSLDEFLDYIGKHLLIGWIIINEALLLEICINSLGCLLLRDHPILGCGDLPF